MFYEKIWNGHDKAVIPNILHEDIKFRGSLGNKLTGHAGFSEYLDMIHESLAEYHCEIEEMVSSSSKVFAKMKFTGIHKGVLMGYKPTGKRVTWSGTALFTFDDDKITDVWVLGDLKTLEDQLCRHET